MLLNTDPDRHDHDPSTLARVVGVREVRLVAKGDPRVFRARAEAYLGANIALGIGFFAESAELVGGDPYRAAGLWLSALQGLKIARAYVVNEFDGLPNSASQSMSPQQVNTWLEAFSPPLRLLYGETLPIAVSSISGDPARYQGVRTDLFTHLDLHLYGEGPQVAAKLDEYRHLGKPILMAEWWADPANTRIALAHPLVQRVGWFWHQPPDAGAMLGIKDSPALIRAFRDLSGGPNVATPKFLPGGGFEAYAASNPLVGLPKSSETYFSPDNSMQYVAGGMMGYAKETDFKVFLPSYETVQKMIQEALAGK